MKENTSEAGSSPSKANTTTRSTTPAQIETAEGEDDDVPATAASEPPVDGGEDRDAEDEGIDPIKKEVDEEDCVTVVEEDEITIECMPPVLM